MSEKNESEPLCQPEPSKQKGPPPKPDIDLKAAAEEIKFHLDDKKWNLIDYSYSNIDLWFEKGDFETGKFPEIEKFTKHWKAVFDYGDTITEDDGTGFPHEIVEDLEADLKKVEDMVNADADYWQKLRAVVIPLYERSPYYKKWQKRWKCVELFWDACPMTVTTTKKMTNRYTEEVVSREVVSERVIPEGFVIRVDRTKKMGGGVIKTSRS